MIKTDANGNELWSKTWGGSGWDQGNSVQQTTDGGYIIVGELASDVYLIKTDASGNELWSKTWGGSKGDYGSSVQQTTEGGYIIAANTYSFGEGGDVWNVYLIKTDANGNELWSKTFGGTNPSWGKSVQQTTDGGYIIAGETFPFRQDWKDVYLLKTDADGNELWSKTFGGRYRDTGRSVQQTTEGGYIIVGRTDSFGAGGWDVYLIKTDANGNEPWQAAYNTLFVSPSDLELLRQYRDEVLSKTAKGSEYKDLLYKSSEGALEVLLENPELIAQAKDLIYANMVAVDDVLHGQEGIIYNTDEITALLDAYAQKAPPALKSLAKMVKWHMLSNQRKGKLFFGFKLE